MSPELKEMARGAIQRLLVAGLDHLFGVAKRGIGYDRSAEHARNFLSTVRVLKQPDRRPGSAGVLLLFDKKVLVGERSDLGQMRDT